MQKSKQLSVIIVNYRSESYLERCIASIYNQLGQAEVEIIIVNNDDKEELRDVAGKFPEVNIVNLRNNPGFGAANNIGVKKAQGKHILFLNPDTEIIEADIAEILSKMNSDSSIGIVGAKIVDAQNNLQAWAIGFSEVNLLDLVKNNLRLAKKRLADEDGQNKIFWVSGAAFLIAKELFWEVGGFDEGYFLYFEDVDLCKAIRKSGKKIKYMSDIVVRHTGGGSHSDKIKQKVDFYRSQDYYFRKHFGSTQANFVKVLRKIFA